MSRRPRIRYSLDTGNIKSLPEGEIKMILRGADELIATGGRSMLVKILKGSKDKKVLEHKLDQCPVYGFYSSLTLEEISHRVDWMIRKDYLQIDYNGRLPVLVFSEKGWEIERETFAQELYQRMDLDRLENNFRVIHEMKDVNRQVVFDVLEKIRASREEGFLPELDAWKSLEVRKVRERIASVEKTLKEQGNGPVIVWLDAQKGDVNRITDLVQDTILKVYPQYYPMDVTEFFCFLHNQYRIKDDVEKGNVGMLFCDGKLVGTGSAEGNHITRVYVSHGEQGRGMGSHIVQELEKRIRRNFDSVELDASAPAEDFYEKRGYKTIRTENFPVGETTQTYKVMKKVFGEQK